MALSGLQIQKLLPKTNCKECGSNTCLAFAMKLAAKKADLNECPYASEEAKAVLGADSEPPVRLVTVGSTKPARIGGETVLYRHEKTFVNQTLIAVDVRTDDPDLPTTLAAIRDYRLERVGEVLTVNAVSITRHGTGEGDFLQAVKQAADITGLAIILRAGDTSAAIAAAALLKGTNSVIADVRAENMGDMRRAAEENGLLLAITASDLDSLIFMSETLKADGFSNFVLQFDTQSLPEAYQTNTIARRAAIRDNYKALGYGTIRFIRTGNEMDDTVEAITEITKYGGICVLPSFDPAQLVALMTLRLNIYTDPQKPIQVEPKIYAIGEPDRNSPVFVTTNFSLTYFIVSGELENSGISCWLAIPECEGMSVLTAWAAGKFSGSHIAKFLKEMKIEEMVDSRRIVIPGYVSQISGELEENLPGWTVLVGPQEASDLEAFIKNILK